MLPRYYFTGQSRVNTGLKSRLQIFNTLKKVKIAVADSRQKMKRAANAAVFVGARALVEDGLQAAAWKSTGPACVSYWVRFPGPWPGAG